MDLSEIHFGVWIGIASILLYVVLGYTLFFAILLFLLFFVLGFVFLIISRGWKRSDELEKEFMNMEFKPSPGLYQLLQRRETFGNHPGTGDQQQPFELRLHTGSQQIDEIVAEIIGNIMRDFVESWYSVLSNDETLPDSLRNSANQIANNLSSCLREVKWEPLLTQHFIDDFASHLRLFRKARGKVDKMKKDGKFQDESEARLTSELESVFFDYELDMEKKYCRDLISTDRKYEEAYLHDLTDILMYLLLPATDFRCRPLRFLLREVIVNKVIIPVVDNLCDPDFINYFIVWLLSEVEVTSDDFMQILEYNPHAEELGEVLEALKFEIAGLRARDTGGQDDAAIKAQLSSLDFVRKNVESRLNRLCGVSQEEVIAEETRLAEETAALCQLDLRFVLNHHIGLSHFVDYLASVDQAQSYIDFYLAIEGFKGSVEHELTQAHLTKVTTGESMDREVLETIREIAQSLWNQYLRPDRRDEILQAVCRVEMDLSLVKAMEQRILNETPKENWFDDIQMHLFDMLEKDVRFYPAFRQSPAFFRMLADLSLVNMDATAGAGGGGDTDNSQKSNSTTGMTTQQQQHDTLISATENPLCDSQDIYDGEMSSGDTFDHNMAPGSSSSQYNDPFDGFSLCHEDARYTAHITTIGIGRESNRSFALYQINANRAKQRPSIPSDATTAVGQFEDEEPVCWTIQRRYSDFHTLNALIESKFPNLATLGILRFPGKRTFNNLNHEFLERRKKALNSYLRALLTPEILVHNSGLDLIVLDFLHQKDYVPDKGILSKKMKSFVAPIRSGMRNVGNAVTAVPDTLFDGMAKMGDGIGKVTKTMLGVGGREDGGFGNGGGGGDSSFGSSSGGGGGNWGRVGAGISGSNAADSNSIPLRIIMLLVDEIFDLRNRNQWFRRKLTNFIQTAISLTLGSSMNRKIFEFVGWLTSEDQVAEYLRTLKNTVWPKGVLAETAQDRPNFVQVRCRVAAKAKMLAALPDELIGVVGSVTARNGIEVVFEALQNIHLNRRFIYVLIERFICALFPGNPFPDKIFPKLHSKSPRYQFS